MCIPRPVLAFIFRPHHADRTGVLQDGRRASGMRVREAECGGRWVSVSRVFKGSINSYGGSAASVRLKTGWRERVAVWLGRLLVVAALWSLISLLLGLEIIGLVVLTWTSGV